MSEQILSQVEVDALLKGLSDGEIKTSQEVEEVDGIRPYDITSMERVVRGRMPTLEMINDKFTRSLRTPLFNFLNRMVDINTEGIKMSKYGDFLKNLHVPSSLNIFRLPPLKGQGILVLDPNLAFLLVDNYFGGDGRFHTRVEGRDFTQIELMVIKKLVLIIFKELNKVWQPVHPVEFQYDRAEINPQFVNIMSPSEVVLVITFRMEIDTLSHNFTFCLPYFMIEPIKDKLFGGFMGESVEVDQRWVERLTDQVRKVPLNCTAELGSVKLRMGDVINLQEGDVIQLDSKASDCITLKLEGVPKFYVRPGVTDGNYSVQLLGPIKERG
ncbi:MAG TPA: flagellar motor switch protein FliM [Deltaproteobacteria bacterium]|nr:flagellar motor switch protein FliM [Deltaproteobacteria bacterium]